MKLLQPFRRNLYVFPLFEVRGIGILLHFRNNIDNELHI